MIKRRIVIGYLALMGSLLGEGFAHAQVPRVEPYLQQGAAAVEAGKPHDALRLLNISLKIDKRNPQTYFYRGLAHYQLKNYRKAARDFRRTLRKDSAFAAAYANLSNTYSELGKYRKAIRTAEYGLHFDPTMPHLYNAIGVGYWHLGEYDLALQYFRKAVEVDSTYDMGYNNIAAAIYANQDIAAAHRRDILRAVRYFRHSLRLNPRLALAHRNLGVMLMLLDRPADAVHHLRQAIQLDPTDAQAYASLGQAHYQMDHYAQALDAWRQAQQLRPPNHPLDIDIGNAHLRLLNYDSAEYYYRRAMKGGRFWKGLAQYNLACAAALQGRFPDAYRHLKKAYRKGYLKEHRHWEWMKKDPDLAGFRRSEWYRKFLEWTP